MNNTISNYEEKQYLWGTAVPRLLMPVVVATGQTIGENELLAIDPATNKAGKIGGTYTDYYGVTMEAITTTADTEVEVIVTGQFRKEALVVTEGHTVDTTKLKAIGLFVK